MECCLASDDFVIGPLVEFLIDCVDVPDPVDNCVDETMVAVSVTNSVIGPLVEFVIDRVVPLVIDPVITVLVNQW